MYKEEEVDDEPQQEDALDDMLDGVTGEITPDDQGYRSEAEKARK